MQMHEIDSLVKWFKENVLEIPNSKNEEAFAEAQKGVKTLSRKEQDDELSLIEYILGINEIEA